MFSNTKCGKVFISKVTHCVIMYTDDTANDNRLTPPFVPLPPENEIMPEQDLEFFECQKCSEYNAVKLKAKARRTTKTRHIRVNAVTWASFKRFCSLNNVSLDYGLMLLLFNARTPNVSYLINSKALVNKK
jgi:hypothetical protein